MALFGPLESLPAQLAGASRWRRAWEYLDEVSRSGTPAHRMLFDLEVGQTERVDLGDGMHALPQVYETRRRKMGRWESHLRHIDVQMLFAGREFLEWADAGRLSLAENRTPAADVLFYEPTARGTVLQLVPGLAAILFPRDAHLGGVAAGEPERVRKVVIKVPVGKGTAEP